MAEAAAVGYVPVDTGARRSNRTTEMATTGRLEASLTFNQDYAAPVHEGTARVIGRPFARQGLDAVTPEIVAAMQQLVEG